MSEVEASVKEENPPPYIIFVVVFLFFLTGLCGFLICHLLKKKGYRCHMEDEEDEEEKLRVNLEDNNEENQDTVERILKCIIENEDNMDAFNEMLESHNVCVRHDPRLRKESIVGLPPHLHTVHSGTDHNTCHLCAQIPFKKGLRPSKMHRFKQRPGEQTVFSVGRFRVTHTDKKQLDSSRVPDVLVASGDLLDQSQDSEDRKDGGYNLRNMFKDVRPSSQSSNGMAPNVGKRKRSLTIFGLRRGSDPISVRVFSTSKDGVKFIPQPIVLEELSENGDNGNKQVTCESKAASANTQTEVPVAVAVEHSKQQTNIESAANSLPVLLNSSFKPSSQTESYKTQSQLDEGSLQTPTS